MRDYVELIKTLRYCNEYDNCGSRCPRFESNGDGDCVDGLMKDAADAIEELIARDVVPMDFHERCLQLEIKKRIELEKQLPQWISVEERLPEENKQIISYLAYKGMSVLQYENKHFYMQGAFQPLPKEAVTHWMPLPAPPKGGNHDN